MQQTHLKYNQKYPQSFTGKERDSETGLSYFGARYYDSDLMTGWLSVDPMADKYPNISPYAYCGWNPIRLVDPDGRMLDEWIVNITTGKTEQKKMKENKVTIVGNGVNESYDFPAGNVCLDIIYSQNDYETSCLISAIGGSEYDKATLLLNYTTTNAGETTKKPVKIGNIKFPEYRRKTSPEGFGIGLTATLCGGIGFSISIGYAQDGLGKGAGYISLNYATGVEAGLGINGFAIGKGQSVKSIEGENQSINFSIPILSTSYNVMSKDISIEKVLILDLNLEHLYKLVKLGRFYEIKFYYCFNCGSYLFCYK